MKAIEPKRQFLASPEAARFADALTQPIVRQGIEVALQQMVMEQMATGDLNAAAVAHIALQGAKRYVEILLNLASPDAPGVRDESGDLKWRSGGKTPPSERAIVARKAV